MEMYVKAEISVVELNDDVIVTSSGFVPEEE